MVQPAGYLEGLTDSRRWEGFLFRPGDIVISVPSKCGTTWLQMMCALLIFGPELPGPLTRLSPWLDMRLRPVDEVRSVLARQQHRRFIKTHTPLDGLPQRDDVTYLVMGRDPRDVAISMAHHRANLDGDLISRRLAAPSDSSDRPSSGSPPMSLHDQVMNWIEDDRATQIALSTLKGVVWHLGDAYRRRDQANIVVFHYAELTDDLEGEIRRLASRLGIDAPTAPWRELARLARLDSMRVDASMVVSDEGIGLLREPDRFFHAGRSGQWTDLLDSDDLNRYETRLAELAEPELIAWLHQEGR
ncbi:glycolipid sulfotransferase [Microlunatus endophyticus]|uniref:Glycolipid sulfotransferase n=1 Tax=Microlunatus endophyticus TaxID=1716077 RepID=A0A917RZJ8_9ACTN|nr:sulfotransferase domain-containing protein [Microlunatus endophyticus]GGL46469.1 glycolipid sulfotransferase [Microlunatus endophyticus]